jgi:hypothetical protein
MRTYGRVCTNLNNTPPLSVRVRIAARVCRTDADDTARKKRLNVRRFYPGYIGLTLANSSMAAITHNQLVIV